MENDNKATPLPGSDEISRNGSMFQYKGYKIFEGHAYFVYNPPVYGRTGFRQKCYIVQKPNRMRIITNDSIDSIERNIDKELNTLPNTDNNSDIRNKLRRGFCRPGNEIKSEKEENNEENSNDSKMSEM